MTRLVIHMQKGNPHTLDFPNEEGAKTALEEVMSALANTDDTAPVTIAGRLVVKPVDVRSAELTSPPSISGFA